MSIGFQESFLTFRNLQHERLNSFFFFTSLQCRVESCERNLSFYDRENFHTSSVDTRNSISTIAKATIVTESERNFMEAFKGKRRREVPCLAVIYKLLTIGEIINVFAFVWLLWGRKNDWTWTWSWSRWTHLRKLSQWARIHCVWSSVSSKSDDNSSELLANRFLRQFQTTVAQDGLEGNTDFFSYFHDFFSLSRLGLMICASTETGYKSRVANSVEL